MSEEQQDVDIALAELKKATNVFHTVLHRCRETGGRVELPPFLTFLSGAFWAELQTWEPVSNVEEPKESE
jgi:hypothetical protein